MTTNVQLYLGDCLDVMREIEAGSVDAVELHDLRPCEREILLLLACGLYDAQILREMGIAPATLNTHKRSLYTNIGVTSRTQAALWALRRGVVTVDGAWGVVCAMECRRRYE